MQRKIFQKDDSLSQRELHLFTFLERVATETRASTKKVRRTAQRKELFDFTLGSPSTALKDLETALKLDDSSTAVLLTKAQVFPLAFGRILSFVFILFF